MMDKNKKDRLQSLTNVTVNALHDKLSPMINSLITHNLVANTIDDELNAYPTRMEKARELHCRVIRGGKSAYEEYYLCLRECGIDDIADRMEDLVDKSVFPEKDVAGSITNLQKNKDVEEPEDEMPEVWPNNEEVSEIPLRKCVKLRDPHFVNICTDIKKKKAFRLPRGFALIINNKTFKKTSNLRTRSSTDKDADLLRDTFTEIGFLVVEKKDCTAKDIIKHVKESAKKDKSQSCFICFILSHGKSGQVYGVDGELMEIETIVNASDLHSLTLSPKLFFIEACQGVNKDLGRDVASSIDASGDSTLFGKRYDKNDTIDGSSRSLDASSRSDIATVLDFLDSEREHEDGGNRVPALVNVFIGMATNDGYVAWINDAKGSWFIQALVFVLKKWSYKDSLDDLFTRVCKLISKQSHMNRGYKQLTNKKSNLTEKFYFLPGVSEKDIADEPPSS